MKQSQKERILEYLQENPEGLHSFRAIRDMWILRVSERIRELKADGYNILSKPEKMGKARGVRYILQ
jgi:DNA-binding Lrp family transcriptional regulator